MRAIWLVILLTSLVSAAAQPAPTISLGSYSYIVGETLELSATNLEPGAGYRVELTPPSAEGEERASTVSVELASQDGSLSYSSRLTYGGTYRVHVTGPRLDATLNVQVSGAESAVGQAPLAEPEAQDGTKEDGSEPAEDQPAQPGTDEQDGVDETEAPGEAGQDPQDDQPAPEGPDGTDADEPGSDEPAVGDERPDVRTPDAESQDDDALLVPDDDQAADEAGPDSTEDPLGGTARQPDPLPERPSRQALPAGAAYGLVDGAVVVEAANGVQLWRLDFPAGSGRTAGLTQWGDRLVVGHGNHLLELDSVSGEVLARHRLPAQVVEVEAAGAQVEATVEYQDGSTAVLRVTRQGPVEALPFDTDPALYGWLRQEANVPNPRERLQQDPTNPWLYVAQVQSAPGGAAMQEDRLLEEALSTSATFYERAQLADAFLSLPTPRTDLAGRAMEAAMEDFVARGYRPELLTSAELQDAYGFPHGRLLNALGRGDMERAGFWAEWLYLTSTPDNPETQAALREYSLYLQETGQRDEASLWRTRANEARAGFQVGATLTQAARTVGRTGWYGVAALVVSIIALHITLLAKYWRPQSLTMLRARAAGRNVSPVLARLSFMRYATWLEKLVVVLLFVAALALAALQGWATQLDQIPPAWGAGTLSSPAALQAVEELDTDRPAALFVRGYAAQSAGDEAAAEQAYSQLPENPAALNNLGVLTGDDEYFQRALMLEAGYEPALYNLGSGPNPYPLLAEHAADEPLVVAPDTELLASAQAGGYLDAWADAFTNPWAALTAMEGVTLAPWLWTVLVVLFLAWAAVSIVFLLVPRPRLARNAPRTLLYHLLALLLPGTGLADEFWGVFLMVPWAIFGVDFLLHYVPGGPDPTMTLRTDSIALIVIYALNLVAFFVEFGSYRRRMVALKHDDPQTAREYGLRVPAPETV